MSDQLPLPASNTGVEFTLLTRGVTVPGHVESATESQLVVRTEVQTYLRKLGVHPGEAVEVYCLGPEDEQTLPARITELESAEELRLQLAVTGPPRLSQRRKAVRAQLELPAEVNHAGNQLFGETVDLSEAGVRVVVDGWGLPPVPGDAVDVTVTLDDVPTAADLAVASDAQRVTLTGLVVRYAERRARWEMSVRFSDVPEKTGDRLRRRVFRALREERAGAED
jgi:c-di-GMP-binding flagellar brake protein YcgR